MKEKKKLTYKQQQQREKTKNIIKWVFVGLGWSLLATAFVSLLVVGIKGCNNKKQPAEALTGNITTPVKPVTPSNIVNGNNVDSSASLTQDDALTWVSLFLGSAQNEVHQGAIYTWEYKSEYENNGFTFPSAIGVHAIFSRSIGTIKTYLNNVVVASSEIRYMGLSASGQYYTFASDPSDIDNTKVQLDSQSMSDGYLDKVVIETYDYFTLDYLKSSEFTCTFTYIGTGQVVSLTPFSYFVFSGGEFVRTYSEPVYVSPESDTGGLEGVFSLIYKAFSSISAFFNMQIIPGVSIGTFIFVPLVVGLIIFIVKLFKR